jgi:putative transcriptional regulator
VDKGKRRKNRLREFREEKNLSAKELARILGVTRRHVYFLETDYRTPSYKLARKISNYLKKPIEDIFLD